MGSNLNNNKRREKQLGMAYGTACNRLRKQILFTILKKHGENFCFQCGAEIETSEELSIEHKNPWIGIDTSLFWDLDNIAFSHLRCNCEAARKIAGPNAYTTETTPNPRRVGPEGTAWCAGLCQAFLPIDRFSKNKSHWNGLQKVCRLCRSKKRSKKMNKNLEALARLQLAT